MTIFTSGSWTRSTVGHELTPSGFHKPTTCTPGSLMVTSTDRYSCRHTFAVSAAVNAAGHDYKVSRET